MRLEAVAFLAAAVAISAAADVPVAVSRDGSGEETDGEVWNRGVDFYRAGDMTNALATVRPLVLSKSHGARAAALAGAIEYAQGIGKSGEDDASAAFEAMRNAAADFQTASRSDPSDAAAGRNLTRALDRLPELRERVRTERALKKYGNANPSATLGSGAAESRRVMSGFPVALTNDPAKAIAACEAMSKSMENLSDMWIAVKRGVAQSVTNEEQAATISAQVEDAKAATEAAAVKIADLDGSAMEDLSKTESAFTRFWKMAVEPPAACDESITAQSNAIVSAECVNGRGWQREALDFTLAFRARFADWAQAYEQQAQADTNKPPFTKEAQAEIASLAAEVEKLQTESIGDEAELKKSKPERTGGGKAAALAAKRFDALKKLRRIKELLPKDGGGGQNQQNQNQQDNQNQNQDRNQDQNKNDDSNQDNQNQNEDSQQDRQQEQQQGDQEKNEEQQQQSPEDRKQDEQVEDVIRRAQERSDQHDADKKARMNKSALPSNERDW